MSTKKYKLRDANDQEYLSDTPGNLGGYRTSGKDRSLYGRLDCTSALQAIAKGGPYIKHRVFFADEATAIAAGYRPCARCLPEKHKAWKARRAEA
jgi:hypothetical protein